MEIKTLKGSKILGHSWPFKPAREPQESEAAGLRGTLGLPPKVCWSAACPPPTPVYFNKEHEIQRGGNSYAFGEAKKQMDE